LVIDEPEQFSGEMDVASPQPTDKSTLSKGSSLNPSKIHYMMLSDMQTNRVVGVTGYHHKQTKIPRGLIMANNSH